MTAKVIFMLTVLIASLVIRIPVFASLLLTAVLFAMVFSGFMPMSVIATGLSSGSVSYTHLDVYKRQLFACANLYSLAIAGRKLSTT